MTLCGRFFLKRSDWLTRICHAVRLERCRSVSSSPARLIGGGASGVEQSVLSYLVGEGNGVKSVADWSELNFSIVGNRLFSTP